MRRELYFLKNVWFPKGRLSLSESKRATRIMREKGFEELSELDGEYKEVVIELRAKARKNSNYLYSDKFEFKKEGGLWIARDLEIRFDSFGNYTLNGLDSKSLRAAYGVSAVCDGEAT